MKPLKTIELDLSDSITASLVESDGYWREMMRREMSIVRGELGIPEDERLFFSWISDGRRKSKRRFQIERMKTGGVLQLSEDWIETRGLTALLNIDERLRRLIGAKTRTLKDGS